MNKSEEEYYLSLSDDQTIREANKTFCDLFGYKIHGLRGVHFESLLSRSSRIFFQIYFEPRIKLNGKIDNMCLSLKASRGEEVMMQIKVEIVERNNEYFYDCYLTNAEDV